MPRRIENECAFCAEEIIEGQGIVGKDWKVYCSERCAESGEKMSLEEWQKAMGEESEVGSYEPQYSEASLTVPSRFFT